MKAAASGIVLGLSVSACFLKPEPPGVKDDASVDPRNDSSPTSDGTVGDSSTPVCPRYEFDGVGVTPCGGWADLASGSLTITNSRLFITAQGSGSGSSAQCTRNTGPVSTVTFDIADLPMTVGTTTDLFIRAGGQRYGARFYSSTQMTPYCAMVEDTPIQWIGHRFLRLRKTTSDTRIDFSADGTTWLTALTSCPPLGETEIAIEVKRNNAGSDATVSLESLEICP